MLQRIAKAAVLALVVGGIATGMSAVASASADTSRTEVAASAEVGPAVGWPFSTCYRRNYYYPVEPGYGFYFYYDHTDFGRINYYRVRDSNGRVVGNGWASCAE